eukprot:scaffold26861_cov45-Tisochrysis_lutea.AAC.1
MRESVLNESDETARQFAFSTLEQLRLDQRLPEAALAQMYGTGKLCRQKRQDVVETMAEISERLGLHVQTAGLAVNIFDRFTARAWQRMTEAKLVAVVSILLAAKFLEVSAPNFNDLSALSKTTREKLRDVELDVLDELSWDLHTPTPHAFAEQLCTVVGASAPVRTRAEFLIDLSYYDHEMLEHSHMIIACSSFLLSWKQLDDHRSAAKHSQLLSQISRTPMSELIRCCDLLDKSFNAILHAQSTTDAANPCMGSHGRVSPSSVMSNFTAEMEHDQQHAHDLVNGGKHFFVPVV